MRIALALLGPTEFIWTDKAVSLGSATTCALIAYLAIEADRPHARERIAALLWPDRPQSAAFNNLRQALARLRQAVPSSAYAVMLEATRHTLRFKADEAVVDVVRFEDLLARCAVHAHADPATCPACIERMDQAAALYRGELLQDLYLEDSQPWEEWLFFKRETFHHQALYVFDTLTRAAESGGDYAAMRRYAQRQVTLEPWREEAHCQVMRALAYGGDRGAALTAYETCRRMLDEALGVAPAAETTALRNRIEAGLPRPSAPPLSLPRAARPPLPGPPAHHPAYEHTVSPVGAKLPTAAFETDSSAGMAMLLEQVYALEQHEETGDAEPLSVPSSVTISTSFAGASQMPNSVSAWPEQTFMLPAAMTPFIGRETEREELTALLRQPGVRLLTLAGAGGMGKTRLAIEAARDQLPACADGAAFVALASVAKAAALPSVIATTLGLAIVGEPTAVLLRFLRDKRMLLVLDNFEHLLDGVPLVIAILENAPNVQVLVTSRARLKVRGEHVYNLEGLAYGPDAATADIFNAPAVRLLVQCARQVQPQFTLDVGAMAAVRRVCKLVGGMPLGLELAAAWMETLELEEIANEIERSADFLAVEWRDAPERQHSIRAVFEWSWRLLNGVEREAFQRLSVFRGGWTRTAAEAVTGTSLSVLTKLVHVSLVRPVEARDTRGVRYEIHELLRQYAELELERAVGEREQVEARHAAFYLALVAAREQRLARGEPREAATELRSDIDNIEKAWAWAVRTDSHGALDSGAVGLWLYCWVTGSSSLGESLFGQAVAHIDAQAGRLDDRNPEVRRLQSKLLALYGFMLIHSSRYEDAVAVVRRAIELGQDNVGAEGEAMAYFVWGEANYRTGQRLEARACMARAVELAHDYQQRYPSLEILRDVEWHAHVWWRGIELSLGNYDASRFHGMEALRLCRSLGKSLGEVHCLCNLGDIAREVRDLPAARQNYEQALRLVPAVGYRWGEGVIQLELGDVVRLQGDYGLARELTERSLAVFREIGDHVEEAHAVAFLGRLHVYMGDYARARDWLAQFLRVTEQVESPEVRVDGLLPLALLAMHAGNTGEALAYAEQGWQLARQYSSRYARAHAAVILGHAYLGEQKLAEARVMYDEALVTYEEVENASLATEPRAGLASVALIGGDVQGALQHVEAILPVLDAQPRVGLDEPFYVYYVCYQILRECSDLRAATVLQTARELLHAYAAHIGDPLLQDSFRQRMMVRWGLVEVDDHPLHAVEQGQ